MAISSPLLEASIDGAHGVLLSIQGGSDLGLFEINEAAQLVSNSAATEANIIFGAVIDDALGDEVRVTVIAAGFDENVTSRPARPASTGASYPAPGGGSGSGWGGAGSTTASAAPGGPLPDSFPVSPDPVAQPAADPEPLVTSLSADAGPVPAGDPYEAAAGDVAGQAADGHGEAGSGLAGADEVPAPRAVEDSASAGTSRSRADPASAARVFDAATTRRRSVVFEDDDELDVPDFLK